LKVQEKSFSQNYKIANINAIRSVYPLSPEMREVIANHSISIYPVDQVAAKAWNLNLESPPAPQLVTAYSDWLDSKNVEWIKSRKASRFMLWTKRSSIDLRNPNWDSPKFQIETICNYHPVLSDDRWLLLERNEMNRCGKSRFLKKVKVPEGRNDIEYQVPVYPKEIVTMKIRQNTTFKDKIIPTLFKPLKQDRIVLDNQSYYFLSKSKQDLVLSVPQIVDFPIPYSYGQKRTLLIPKNLEIEIFVTKVRD
jgi:hypothetical protein